MLACTVVFLSGGLMQTEVCRYAMHHYPAGPAVLDDALEAFAEYQLRQSVRLPTNSPSLDPNVSQHLKNLAIARPFSVLLTRCANESLVDSLGDKVVGMMVSDTVSWASTSSTYPAKFLCALALERELHCLY